jgi:hypothetical protein
MPASVLGTQTRPLILCSLTLSRERENVRFRAKNAQFLAAWIWAAASRGPFSACSGPGIERFREGRTRAAGGNPATTELRTGCGLLYQRLRNG